VEAPVTTHDPFTRGSAVTILPGVPLDGVPAQRTESPAPEAQAPATPAAQAPFAPPAHAPVAPPAAGFSAPAAAPAAGFPPPAPVPPAGVPVPPPAAALPPAGPAYVPQAQAFPIAPVFDADIPAAPAAFPIDVPAATVSAPSQASPFTPTPAPAFPPADAVTPIPVQPAPFQPALTQPVPLPELDVTPEDKQSKTGKRRKEGSGSVSPAKVLAIGAAVVGLAAGWFGHSALSSSDSDTSTPAPVVTHAPTPRVVPLSSISAIGPTHVLPKPWVTTGEQALLSSSVVSSTTPVYYGSPNHGTFADMGVSVGTLSTVAAARGDAFPAGPGGGTVRCGINVIQGQAVSWCTWKDAKSSGMLARFATPTTTEAYRWTQLVRQTLEP
jgi:hypothetical protein